MNRKCWAEIWIYSTANPFAKFCSAFLNNWNWNFSIIQCQIYLVKNLRIEFLPRPLLSSIDSIFLVISPIKSWNICGQQLETNFNIWNSLVINDRFGKFFAIKLPKTRSTKILIQNKYLDYCSVWELFDILLTKNFLLELLTINRNTSSLFFYLWI